jgi:hypothetical protein
MAVHRSSSVDRVDLQPLNHSDLEHHIDRAAAEIARGAEPPSLPYSHDQELPLQISTAEFVQRMSQFLVFN